MKLYSFHILSAVCTLTFAFPTIASGPMMGEPGYANLGVAGAGDGVYHQSAMSMWTNPAAMSLQDGHQTSLGLMAYHLTVDYIGDENADANSALPIATFAHSYPINDDFKIGLVFNTLGGATLDYGNEWQGRFQLTEVMLLSYQINPSISYQLNDRWGIAAGLQFDFAFLEQETALLKLDRDIDTTFGFNVGTIYALSDEITLGLSYRSQIEHDFSGDAFMQTAQGEYKVTLMSAPALVDFSAAYHITETTSLLSSIQWHQWSEMKETPLMLNFSGIQQAAPVERNWEDVYRLSLGIDHQINSAWSIKMGYAFETSPLDNPQYQAPDMPTTGKQHRIAVGASKRLSQAEFSFYYQYTNAEEIDINQPNSLLQDGSLSVSAHYIGMLYDF
ncbi:outer membrane protein P1 [Vibrio ichthyoenteri ATCC 700023]|uniref:Outer membrane protein P1 n=1 Tax=Vibrio ichthyoenteri ATCC 700023 TaxID=870968 RepID=F9S845_9VIBR|nr:outer membrane protein transport protein [Vibrio ichthyoenteri]EGU30522.1 outer membrane protein P1 [Vibrio ichthyoenteri ATCC 700023]